MEEMKHTTEASVLESKLGRQVEQFTSKWSKFRPVEISLKQVSPQLFLIWLARAGSPVPEYRRYLATPLVVTRPGTSIYTNYCISH